MTAPDLSRLSGSPTDQAPDGATIDHLPAHTDKQATLAGPTEQTALVSAARCPPGYEVIRELGRGGMGVVYQARQLALDRPCALKVILAGSHAGGDELQRFQTEAEAIARLPHPHIVQVYEIGHHEERPYLALELCTGGSLERKLSGTPLQPRDAAEVVCKLATAMQAAHEAKVIHRDLKPANVLLTAEGEPKITDFGLAKKLDEVGQTQTGAVMGTPSYMPPEQAQGHKDIGPTADVYALGAILYECLTGRPPFKAATSFDTIVQVVTQEPVPPTQFNAKVPRDLETIALKCLRKDAGRRYGSGQELADDLERFLKGEAIWARPVGAGERAVKWVRRNKAAAAVMSLVLWLLVLGTGVTWKLVTAELRQKEEAEKREREAQQKVEFVAYASRIREAQIEIDQGRLPEAEAILHQNTSPLNGWEHAYLLRQVQKTLWTGAKHTGQVTSVAVTADGKRIVSGSDDNTVKVWDAQTGLEALTLKGHTREVLSVAVTADGKRIVSGSYDNTVKVWDAQTGQEALSLKGHTGIVTSVAVTADGKRIVSGSFDNTVKVWDAQTGQEALTLKGHTSVVRSVAVTADGKRIVSGSQDQTVKVWDTQTGQEALTLKGHTKGVSSVAVTADSKRIVSGSYDNTVKVWDAQTGQEALTLKGHTHPVSSVAVTADGRRLVSGSDDNTVKVWDAQTGQEVLTLKGHTKGVSSVAFSPDGKRLVSGSDDATVKVWDARTGQEARTLKGQMGHVLSVALTADGKRIVSGSEDGTLKVWDAQTGQEALTLKGHTHRVSSVAVTADGKRIVSGSDDGTLKVWDAQRGKEALTLMGHTNRVLSVAVTADGKRIVSGSGVNTVKVWDAHTGQEALTLKGHTKGVSSVAVTADGKRIISGSDDNTVKVWDAQTGQEALTLKGHTHPVSSVAVTADGKRIVSGSFDNTVKVWDATPIQADRPQR